MFRKKIAYLDYGTTPSYSAYVVREGNIVEMLLFSPSSDFIEKTLELQGYRVVNFCGDVESDGIIGGITRVSGIQELSWREWGYRVDYQKKWEERVKPKPHVCIPDVKMKRFVVVSKTSDGVVFLKRCEQSGRSNEFIWTQDINEAMLFDGGDENNNSYCIACWSGGFPASMIMVEADIVTRIFDSDTFKKWQEWELPDSTYRDSPSGCHRYVVCGPPVTRDQI